MIIITTMNELPEYCYDCPCNDGENGRCKADKDGSGTCIDRPWWCPLSKLVPCNVENYRCYACNKLIQKDEMFYYSHSGVRLCEHCHEELTEIARKNE